MQPTEEKLNNTNQIGFPLKAPDTKPVLRPGLPVCIADSTFVKNIFY